MDTASADLEPRRSLLLRGVLDMCVLALVNHQPDHVYGLAGRLADQGLGKVSFGSLYPLVSRLRQQRLLHDTVESSPSGPDRSVLSLTSDGVAALQRWSNQWQAMNSTVGAIVFSHPLDRAPPEETA